MGPKTLFIKAPIIASAVLQEILCRTTLFILSVIRPAMLHDSVFVLCASCRHLYAAVSGHSRAKRCRLSKPLPGFLFRNLLEVTIARKPYYVPQIPIMIT